MGTTTNIDDILTRWETATAEQVAVARSAWVDHVAAATVVAVQASLVSWEGGPDLCANLLAGRPVVEHTIERARLVAGPDIACVVVAPDLPGNEALGPIADRHGAELRLGSPNDVVSRYLDLADNYSWCIRVLGLHPFFSAALMIDLLARRSERTTAVALVPPDSLEVQFGAQLLSLDKLADYAHDDGPRRDPIAFLESCQARVSRLAEGFYVTESDRTALRRLAEQVYQHDILLTQSMGLDEVTVNGLREDSQIFAHYGAALDWLRSRPELGRSGRPVRVLDLGGGFGFGPWLRQRSSVPLSYTLLDVDSAKLAAAISNDPQTTTVLGDATAIDLADDSFDLVLAFELLEHVERPEAVLAEGLRVARPGGVMIVSTPQNRSGGLPLNPNHLFELTREEFDQLCRSVCDEPVYRTFGSGADWRPGLAVGNNMLAILTGGDNGPRHA